MTISHDGEKREALLLRTHSGSVRRLHHAGYVTTDMEMTRQFYEDVIGLPLVATYCEVAELFGAQREYCHCFFGLEDGSALAFFQFANQSDHDEFKSKEAQSPFFHTAFECSKETLEAILQRLNESGRGQNTMILDHGYCLSLYFDDPNGVHLEFTADSDAVDLKSPVYSDARGELQRWLGGDHTPNNPLRHD